jgi:hypothetical protein
MVADTGVSHVATGSGICTAAKAADEAGLLRHEADPGNDFLADFSALAGHSVCVD